MMFYIPIPDNLPYSPLAPPVVPPPPYSLHREDNTSPEKSTKSVPSPPRGKTKPDPHPLLPRLSKVSLHRE